MTLFYYYGSGDLGNAAVRLGTGFALTEYAEAGTIASSQVLVDDPSGAVTLVGLKTLNVDETACAWRRLFTGYMAERTVQREASLKTGAARRWNSTVMDANLALNLRVLRGSAANRPAETDIARITWYLGTVYTSGIGSALTFIDTSGAVNLEAADYRGRTGSDVFSDAAQVSGKNFFVAYDDTTHQLLAHYYVSTSTFNTCTLKISNTLADIDLSTVYGVGDPSLSRDPSRVFSGVYLNYGSGAAAVYVNNPTTESTFIARDQVVSESQVKGSTQAINKANQYLTLGSTEFDTIKCHIPNLSAAQANLIRQGQRIQVKFTHLPGYTAYTYIRINKRTIKQAGETDALYDLDLELSNTKLSPGTWNPGAPPGDDIAPTNGAAVGLSRYQLAEELGSGFFGPAAGLWDQIPPAFAFSSLSSPVAGSVLKEPKQNVPWPYTDCGVGSGAVAGLEIEEAWYRFQVDLSDQTIVGITFTIAALRSPTGFLVGAGTIVCGIHTGASSSGAEVTAHGDYTEVGRIGDSGGTVFVPRSLLIDDGSGYCWFVLAPGWEISDGLLICVGSPKPEGSGGTGASSGGDAPSIVSAVLVTLQGTGETPWVGIGTGDGTTTTFTLVGWDGSGTPEVRIDGLSLPAGEYTYSSSGGTVTFLSPPVQDAQLAARFHFGAGTRP